MPKEFEFITLEGLQAFKEESEAQNNGAYASKLSITQDATTGVITIKLFAKDNTLLDTKTLDLETEKIIKSVSLNYASKLLVFTLSDDSTINCDISDLIDTLEAKIKAEETRAKDAEQGLDTRVNTIENDYLTSSDKTELADDIEAEETRAKAVEKSIKDKIPTEATAQNQLADKEWVNRNGGKIDSVSIDGTPVEPDVNKNVDLPAYPTRVSLAINNVNNTSDMEKPVSTAQKEAIDASGHRIALEINSETYEIVAKLYDANDNLISTSNVIDLPLESVVVSGRYDAVTKDVVLTLEGGSVIRFSVADLIYGLQSEITANNPLSSDLVSDDNNAHKFVSANEKAQITTNKNDIAGIKNGAEINNFDDTEKALAKKQNTIDADHKLSATLISETTNKQFISGEEKAQINSNKQAIIDIKNGTSIESFDDVEKALAKKQATIDSDHKLSANLIEENANKKFVSETEKQKLADLENYDDTEVRGLITAEANRATKQENKALYFKGAFDSDDGKTRQTLYGKLEDLNWIYVSSTNNYTSTDLMGKIQGANTDGSGAIITWICSTTKSTYADDVYLGNIGFGVGTTGQIYFKNSDTTSNNKPKGYYQIKSITSYTDDGVIAGESLLPLDANMANKIRQDVVDSLQLLTLPNIQSKTQGGITWLVNNQVITITGSVESGEYPQLFGNGLSLFLKAGTYTINKGIENLNLYLWVGKEEPNSIVNTNARYKTFTLTSDSNVLVNLVATPGGVFDNQKLTIMLNEGAYAYLHSDYNANKHITNDEALLVKNEYKKCSNLFDNSLLKVGIGIDGSNGGAVTDPNYIGIVEFIPLKPNTTYTLSSGKAYLYDSSKAYIGYQDTTFITPSNCAYMRFDERSGLKNIMLNYGDTSELYQKHYGPIVHTTEAFEAVGGSKNLLDPNKLNFSSSYYTLTQNNGLFTLVSNGNGNVAFGSFENIYLEKGKTYTISKQNITYDTDGIGLYFEEGGTRYYNQFTPSSSGYYVLYLRIQLTYSGTITFNIMLNEGDTSLPYKQRTGNIIFEKDLEEAITTAITDAITTTLNTAV